MDALEALCNGFKFEKIVENIDDLPTVYDKDNAKKKLS